MRRHRAAILALTLGLVLAGSGSRADGSLDGHWSGAFDRDGSIQMVEMDFATSGDTLSGSYAIPELGIYEEPASDIAVTDSSLQVRLLYGLFFMVRHSGTGELTGLSGGVNPPIKLHLKKQSLVAPPFFFKENLAFQNDHVVIAATLYKPAGSGPFPAAVIIPGSGEIGRADWSYRSAVYGLARRGIAALVYDKRGIGESTGSLSTADFKDLAKDVREMVDSLRKRSDIMADEVGLYAIGEGGWIAAAAGRKSKEIAFMVLVESPAVGVWQQRLDAIEYTMRADNFPQPAIDSALSYTWLYFEAVKSKKKWNQLVPWGRKALKATWAKYVDIPLRPDDVNMVRFRVNNYDPADDFSHVRCPVLAMFAENDTQIPPQTNVEKVKAYMAKAEVKYSIIIIPKLGHSAITAERLEGGTWDWPRNYWVWPRRQEMIDSAAASWILGNSK